LPLHPPRSNTGVEADQPSSDPPADPQEAAPPEPVQKVWAEFHRGAVAGGITLGEAAVAVLPNHGEAWYALACCHERAGELLVADRLFGRAARTSHEPRSRPWRVSWRRFCSEVDRAIEGLPPALRQVLTQEVTLILADYADGSLAERCHTGGELLGYFSGHTRGDRGAGASDPVLNPRIFIYRRAHEHAVISASEFRDEVRRTLVHELGHYVGFDEEDLEGLGLE
jgi:predicted Zn-dependent protease with MMP-like domain